MDDKRLRFPRTGMPLTFRRADQAEERTEAHAAPEVKAEPPQHLWDSVVGCGIYDEGTRVGSPDSLDEALDALADRPSGFLWIGLYRPSDTNLAILAEAFDLHPLAVEDAIEIHQRPKVERYGDTLFVALRAARYLDQAEEVEFGELHIFLGRNFIISVRHSESPDLSEVRSRLESQPELMALGTEAVLYGVLDTVVDAYAPVLDGVENDIDEIELEVFNGDPWVSRRIYELSQEVTQLLRSLHPLRTLLVMLDREWDRGPNDREIDRYFRDVADHATVFSERVENFRSQLRDILTVNATLVAQRQNEEMRVLSETSNSQNEEVKKISAWAAILFAPTLVGTVYGMNFEVMPELAWTWGYPMAVAMMFGVSITLHRVFKSRGWI